MEAIEKVEARRKGEGQKATGTAAPIPFAVAIPYCNGGVLHALHAGGDGL